jgi:hypothetical protein
MSCMIDKWHDAYHAEAPDYVNCPYCQDELTLTMALPLPQVSIDMEAEWGAWIETTYDPDNGHIDRLEDLEH